MNIATDVTEIHFYNSRKIHLVMILKSSATVLIIAYIQHQKSIGHAIHETNLITFTVSQKLKNEKKTDVFKILTSQMSHMVK